MKSLSLNQPHVIVMVGGPGTGKSHFADKFAETFSAPIVSHDTIEEIAATTPRDTKGIADYQLAELLKTKQSIVVDGGADARTDRTAIHKIAKAHGYETLFVWVQTDPATAEQRSTRVAKNKVGKTLSPDEFDARVAKFKAPHPSEKPVVISGKHTYATQAKVVLTRLSAPRAEISAHSTPPIRKSETPGRRNITIR